MRTPSEKLADLLSEPLEAVLERERTTFDRLAGGKPTVLIGTGYFGQKMARHLTGAGKPPLCFAIDFPESAIGTTCENIPVLGIDEAIERYRNEAVFVVTFYTPNGGRFDQAAARLAARGCPAIASFVHYAWKHPEPFFSYYFLDAPHQVYQKADQVADCHRLWEDAASVREYVAQIAWRTRFEFDDLNFPESATLDYFPADIISLRDDEVIIDCGGYDGDTIRDVVQKIGHRFSRMVVFEADSKNFGRLKEFVETGLTEEIASRIELHEAAVGARTGLARFINAGYDGSSLADTRSVSPAVDVKNAPEQTEHFTEVRCVTLDDALMETPPTFIKFDIEGAELDALEGSRHVISGHRPILAVSAYHKQSHLWEIPLCIAAIADDYAFFLRRYNESLWDTIIYAVPRERLP